MNNIINHAGHFWPVLNKKTYLAKGIVSIWILLLLQVNAYAFAQNVSVNVKKASLKEVLDRMQEQTKYDFMYNADQLANLPPITLNVSNRSLPEVLDYCLKETDFTYIIDNKMVVIRKKEIPKERSTSTVQQLITGKVIDEKKQPITGATIRVKGDDRSYLTDEHGEFVLAESLNGKVIILSYLGYHTIEVTVDANKKPWVIALEPAENILEEVTINTGIFSRSKSSFTGAVNTYSTDELKQVSNGNVIQSLKTLDPSFIVTTNNLAGSNPNTMPNIELRGKSSVPSSSSQLNNQFANDPNMPLFVLDGFETTLQQVVDMDINRIESITVLKDAAATAIYGGNAANGVVVIETKKPKPGELRVRYTNDTRFELPDLTAYNMMDARQLLDFQQLSGLYTSNNYQHYLDSIYNVRLREINKGVDTYWLSEPLRDFGVTEGNSVNLNGGSENFQFDMGLNYRLLNGLMKGSGRNAWGGNVKINYRLKNINFTNNIYINGYTANESPYGSFSQYVNLPPYFRKYDEDGNLMTNRYLFEVDAAALGFTMPPLSSYANPFYNASLTFRDRNNAYNITDNFGLIWDVNTDFRFQAGGQIIADHVQHVQFTSPENTRYDGIPVDQRGSYTDATSRNLAYQFNAMLTYAKVLNEVHSINANIRGDINHAGNNYNAFTAIGFPEGAKPNPYYATQYEVDARPGYSAGKTRAMSLLGSINYSYDYRYFADATYRTNGTSVFGSARRFSSFYSFGAGWNINREEFLKDVSWLSQLRLRANYGITGNQNLGSYTSQSVYDFLGAQSPFGVGTYLSSLGRPELGWQKTKDLSTGIDANLMGNRATFTFNYFRRVSDPLVLNIDIPASQGFTSAFFNAGKMTTTGIEWMANYSPIYDLQRNIVWTIGINGAKTKSVYGGGITNLLAAQNGLAQDGTAAPGAPAGGSDNSLNFNENYLNRYQDGYSPDDLWAVRSLGIDPSTGAEAFLTKDGQPTNTFDAGDAVRLGSRQPVVQGIISSTLTYKSFNVGLFLRYAVGGYIMNTALYQRAENIGPVQLVNNQDVRALERWASYGQIAGFKDVALGSYTPISSRFVQKENFITGESISVGYEMNGNKYAFLKTVGIKNLRVNGILNDIFRLSNIRAERGLDYPYNRVVSFSVNADF